MFRGSIEIQPVVDRLMLRGVSLWHACQLMDFESYLAIGGIPSRSLLEQAHLPFTGFVTDKTDRTGGVWSKVFVNLSDFGGAFAHGSTGVPNPYGPIAFQIRPSALERAIDAAFCLRSAGARDFSRDEESLGTVDDIERIFMHPIDAGFPRSGHPKHRDQLRDAFSPRFPDATAAEVSLTLDPELIPLSEVIAVWVDPIQVGERMLAEVVAELAAGHGIDRVHGRWMSEERRVILADVVRYVADASGPPSLQTLARRGDLGPVTREWAVAVLERGLDWQFARYASYLREGTLLTAQRGASLPRAAESRAPYQSEILPF
jgi:hypothetical protein